MKTVLLKWYPDTRHSNVRYQISNRNLEMSRAPLLAIREIIETKLSVSIKLRCATAQDDNSSATVCLPQFIRQRVCVRPALSGKMV